MAKGMKTGGKDFVKGQKGGPGRTPLPPDLKEARQLRAIEFESIIYKYMDHSPVEIKRILDENNEIIDGKRVSKLPAKELIVLKLVHKAMEDGDLSRLNFLLERTIGKIPEKIDLTADIQTRTLHDMILKEIEGEK